MLTFDNDGVPIRKRPVEKELDYHRRFLHNRLGSISVREKAKMKLFAYTQFLFQPLRSRQCGFILCPCFLHSGNNTRFAMVVSSISTQHVDRNLQFLIDLLRFLHCSSGGHQGIVNAL